MSTTSDTTISAPACVLLIVAMTTASPRCRPVICPVAASTVMIFASELLQTIWLGGGVCVLVPSKEVTAGGGVLAPTKSESRIGSSITRGVGDVEDPMQAASAAQSAQANEGRVIARPQGDTAKSV